MDEERQSTHGSDPELYQFYVSYWQALKAEKPATPEPRDPKEFERWWEEDMDEDLRVVLEGNYRTGRNKSTPDTAGARADARAILEKYTKRPRT